MTPPNGPQPSDDTREGAPSSDGKPTKPNSPPITEERIAELRRTTEAVLAEDPQHVRPLTKAAVGTLALLDHIAKVEGRLDMSFRAGKRLMIEKSAALSQRDELAKALEPYISSAEHYFIPNTSGEGALTWPEDEQFGVTVTVGDAIRAREALARAPAPPAPASGEGEQ